MGKVCRNKIASIECRRDPMVLKADPDRIVARVADTGAAVLLSHPGAPVAVLQSLSDYRKDQDE